MTTQASKADHFHRLHVAGDPLVLFNVWDAGSTKAVAAGGARAIATGSWSVAAANGYADGERMPIDAALVNLKRIVDATALPVTIDLESGYGADPHAVGRTVTRAIDAGAIGCNLEDSFPHDGSLRPQEEQSRRIAAARAAADATGIRFFLNARTDVFMLAKSEGHDEALVSLALERATAYAAHGADGLFVPGLINPALIERIVKASPLPVNIMMAEGAPSIRALADLGVARVSHGPWPYIALMKQLEEAARSALA